MPVIYKEDIDASLMMEVWNFTESEASLLSQLILKETDRQNILSLPLPKRRLEKLACRCALQDILRNHQMPLQIEALSYTSTGAPKLAPLHISFSHSNHYAAVALSPLHSVGIDIEKIGHRLQNSYAHFLNEHEISEIDIHNDRLLNYYMGAKEAIYKAHSIGMIDYHEDIHILPIKTHQAYLINNGQKTNDHLFHREIDGNCMVVAVKE